jgi:glycosyltransferase involved in cell wall biosynthesis
VATGFAGVARNMLEVLHKTGRYEFVILGINQGDWYDREKYPYRIHEAMPALGPQGDIYGFRRLLEFLATGEFDLLFTLQDSFIIERIAKQIVQIRNELIKQVGRAKAFQWISYFPVDAPFKPNWVKESIALSDFPVTYTEYGKGEVLRWMPELESRLRVIYHGTNLKDFYPMEDRAKVDQFRKEFFKGVTDNKFLITNVNRNQPRKDIDRTLRVFSLFRSIVGGAQLYVHAQAQDVGGSLLEMARNYQLGDSLTLPNPRLFTANQGYPIEMVNLVYNASDVVVTTTLGEGWGLSVSEAMRCGTPVLVPRHTSFVEMIGQNEERGYLTPSGTNPSLHFVLGVDDNERVRPLVDVETMVDKLLWIYKHQDEAKAKAQAASAWISRLAWDSPEIGGKWIEVFRNAETRLDEWRTKKVGRNDPCFCGSGEKQKKCHPTPN